MTRYFWEVERIPPFTCSFLIFFLCSSVLIRAVLLPPNMRTWCKLASTGGDEGTHGLPHNFALGLVMLDHNFVSAPAGASQAPWKVRVLSRASQHGLQHVWRRSAAAKYTASVGSAPPFCFAIGPLESSINVVPVTRHYGCIQSSRFQTPKNKKRNN